MQMTKACLLTWLGLFPMLCPNSALAQASENTCRANPFVCAIKTVGSDVAYVFSSPLRLTTKGGVELLVISAVTTGFVFTADETIDEELALEGYEFSSQPFKALAKLGQVYDDITPVNFAIGLSAMTLAGGLALHDKKLLQTSRLLVESVVLTQLFTAVSKGVFGRARPHVDHGPRDFNFFKFSQSEDFKSMPSGHVSSAFALMTVLAKQYEHWYVEIPAYTFAVSVAFQRMTSRSHWASDTILGGAIGYWVSNVLVQKQRRPSKSPSLNFYPAGNGLGVVMQF